MSGSDRRLTVDAADTVAQISVLDGNLNQVAQGVGRLSEQLSPGLYKVRVRVGPTTDERLVSLDADRHETFGVQDFPSAVPLHNTSRSHEYHIEEARELSSRPKTVLGSGATIFVFSREWLPPEGNGVSNPAAGLRLVDASGKLLADLEKIAEIRTTADPSAGCSIAVAPGEYRLRLDGPAYERALIAVAGWQTQIFMLQRDDGKVRRPDLEGAAMVMSNRGHFEPNDKLTRLSELARYALAQHHKILSDDLQQLLSGKCDDPMLGLFGAHLIIRDMPEDHGLLDTVLANLEAVLGSNHPDVMALCLKRKSPQTTIIKEFHQPPMLRASWDLVVEASFGSPITVAMDSSVESIGAEVLPNASWLVWRRTTAATAVAEEPAARPAVIAAVADFTRGLVENIRAGVSQAVQPVGSPVASPSELGEALRAKLAEGTSLAVEAVVAAVGSSVTSPSELAEAFKVKLAEGTSRAVEAVVGAVGSPVASPSELGEALRVKLAEGTSQAVEAVVGAVGPVTSPSELGEALKVKLAEGTSRAVDAVVEPLGSPVTGAPSELDEASKAELARSFGMPRSVLEAMLDKLPK